MNAGGSATAGAGTTTTAALESRTVSINLSERRKARQDNIGNIGSGREGGRMNTKGEKRGNTPG